MSSKYDFSAGENDVPVGFLDNIETLPMELGSIEVPMETPEEEIEEVDDEVEISEALDQVTTVVATEKPDVVPEDPAFWTDSQIPEEMFAEEPLPPLEPVGEEEVPEKQEGSVPVAEESSEQTPDEAGSDPTTTTATGPESERRAKEERAKEEPEDVEVVESDEGEGEREAKGTFKEGACDVYVSNQCSHLIIGIDIISIELLLIDLTHLNLGRTGNLCVNRSHLTMRRLWTSVWC